MASSFPAPHLATSKSPAQTPGLLSTCQHPGLAWGGVQFPPRCLKRLGLPRCAEIPLGGNQV